MARLRFHRLVDVPKRRLRAITAPMRCLSLADCVPARLMLHMIIAAANRELLFRPDYLHSYFKPGGTQRFKMLHLNGTRRVPLINHITGKQHPCTAPISAIIIARSPYGPRAIGLAIRSICAIAPVGIILDTVR